MAIQVPEPIGVPELVAPGPAPQSRGVIAEVAVIGLEADLLDLAYKTVISTGILGHNLTDATLQDAINALNATGWFVEARAEVIPIPVNSPSGTSVPLLTRPDPAERQRVTFIVKANPPLGRVQPINNQIKTLQVNGVDESLETLMDQIFQTQYGSTINPSSDPDFRAGIDQVLKIYRDNGYTMATYMGGATMGRDGVISLPIAEGAIVGVTLTSQTSDAEGNPIPEAEGHNQCLINTQDIEDAVYSQLKGSVFKEGDLKRYENTVFDKAVALDVKVRPRQASSGSGTLLEVKILNEGLTEFQQRLRGAIYARIQGTGDKNPCLLQAASSYQAALELAPTNQDRAFILLSLGNLYWQRARETTALSPEQQYQRALTFYRQALPLFRDDLSSPLLAVFTLNNIAITQMSLAQPGDAIATWEQVFPALERVRINPRADQLDFSKTGFEELLAGRPENLNLLLKLAELFTRLQMISAYHSMADYQQAGILMEQSYPVLRDTLKDAFIAFKQSKSPQEARKYDAYSGLVNGFIDGLTQFLTLQDLEFITTDLGDQARATTYRIKKQGLINSALAGSKTLVEGDLLGLDDQAQSVINQFFPTFLNLVWSDPDNVDPTSALSLFSQLSEDLGADQSFSNYIGLLTQFANSLGADGDIAPEGYDSFLKLFEELGFNEKSGGLFSFLESVFQLEKGSAYLDRQQPDQAISTYCSVLESLQVDCQQTTYGASDLPEIEISEVSTWAFVAVPQLFHLLGKAYFQRGDLARSQAYYQQALALIGPNVQNLTTAEIYYDLSRSDRQLNQFAEALEHNQRAIRAIEQVAPPPIKYQSTPGVFGNLRLDAFIDFPSTGRMVAGLETRPNNPQPSKPSSTNFCSKTDNYSACRQRYYAAYLDLLVDRHTAEGAKGYDRMAFGASDRSLIPTLDLADNLAKDQLNPLVDPLSNRSGQELIDRLQQQVLDKDTLLLEYSLANPTSYLWVVSQNQIQTLTLPAADDINRVAQEFYGLLTSPSGRVRPQTTARVGRQLRHLILDPVGSQLQGKRLLVVADGMLQSIPFGALPSPRSDYRSPPVSGQGEFAAWMEPLLVDQEIIHLPSASKLLEIRSRQAQKPAATKELMVFADPVFHPQDERYLNSSQAEALEPGSTGIDLLDKLPEDLKIIYPRLPETQAEAEAISRWVAPDRRRIYQGFAATHQTALSPELGQYRIIHFATHGIFNQQSPVRSGVVLSAIDEAGQPQRGLVSPLDSRQLHLAAADLVVLSGCRTGLKDSAKEAIPGLIGNLMAAGSDRVVASLWSVRSKPTQELMSRFYQRMFDPTHPEYSRSPAQALRAAQLSMWQDPRWQTPYYWAAFMFQGEWR
jgi:CHAT domain-containing protein